MQTEADLGKIGTLGFRGEALASVASVAKVDMLTSTDGNIGTAYSIHGGEEVAYTESGCPRGTTIIVRELFYNTPARMKFLKKDVSESNAVADVLDRMALSHPEISFRFIRDGKQTLLTSGKGGLAAAIYAVYGREFASGMLEVKGSHGHITVSGMICKPTHSRKSRNMQHFFINGRFVKSKTMMAALEQAYKGSIMVGNYPSCVLNLDLPYDSVDINVHPAKIECRFVNEKEVFDSVYHAVKATLQLSQPREEFKLSDIPDTTVLRPAVNVPQTHQLSMDTSPEPVGQPRVDIMREFANAQPFTQPRRAESTSSVVRSPQAEYTADSAANITEAETVFPREESDFTTQEKVNITFIGEAFNTYAIAQAGDELIIIDKHAAHERILYEKLRAGDNTDSQLLLEPEAVTLSKDELGAIMDNIDKVNAAGFEIEEFGSGCLLVRAVPAIVADCDVNALITEMAAGFIENKNAVEIDRIDWLYHNIACRAAVKGGDKSGDDLIALAERIAGSDDIRYCPHGRPVAFRLTRKELEKQFGRQG